MLSFWRSLNRNIIQKYSPTGLFLFKQQREIHGRNKKAMEFIAKGWNAVKEVDRVIDYCELNDRRLIPHLRTAKENFELALEADNSNTHARYWLAKLHLKYHVPGANKAVGAALLVEAADMADPDAQYELGCRLRVDNYYVQSDQQAFYYLEKAVDQLHPEALYLLGAVYLTGDCVKKDIVIETSLSCHLLAKFTTGVQGIEVVFREVLLERESIEGWRVERALEWPLHGFVICDPVFYHIASALWCFHRASEKGHAGAAVAYGSLILKGVEVPESITKFISKRDYTAKKARRDTESAVTDPVEMAREQFRRAAKSGCDLGLKWLQRLEEEEKHLKIK